MMLIINGSSNAVNVGFLNIVVNEQIFKCYSWTDRRTYLENLWLEMMIGPHRRLAQCHVPDVACDIWWGWKWLVSSFLRSPVDKHQRCRDAESIYRFDSHFESSFYRLNKGKSLEQVDIWSLNLNDINIRDHKTMYLIYLNDDRFFSDILEQLPVGGFCIHQHKDWEDYAKESFQDFHFKSNHNRFA